MKKLLIALSLAAIAMPSLSSAQMNPETRLVFKDLGMNSVTVSIVPGTDGYGGVIQKRQALRMKYRPVAKDEPSTPRMNGTEKEVPLEYTLDSFEPIAPVRLSGLRTNQKYAVWMGVTATRQCVGDTPCTAIYIDYERSSPFLFSTKFDPGSVQTIQKNLSFQSKSKDVALLQKYLVANGYMQAPAGQSFDVQTLVGVIRFQIASGGTADGVVGSGSRAVINRWLLAQAQN